MSTFNRRSLFSLGLASAGASLLPQWLARWFGAAGAAGTAQDPEQQAAQAAAREKQLHAAIAVARREGKPLLVFMVPTDVSNRVVYYRGHWFGAFLTHGGQLAKLEVGLGVAACATVGELQKLLGVKVMETAPMAWVDVTEGAAKATAVDVELGEFGAPYEGEETPAAHDKRTRELIEAKLKEMTGALVAARNRHEATIAGLAAAAAQHLHDTDKLLLEEWLASGEGTPNEPVLVRGAAIVRQRVATVDDARRKKLLDGLEAAVEHVVVRRELAGGRWMAPGGCGSEPEFPTKEEQEQNMRIACGMGMVTPLGNRFLSFYIVQ